MKFGFILCFVYVLINSTHENPDSSTAKTQEENSSSMKHTTKQSTSKSVQNITNPESASKSANENQNITNQESVSKSANEKQNITNQESVSKSANENQNITNQKSVSKSANENQNIMNKELFTLSASSPRATASHFNQSRLKLFQLKEPDPYENSRENEIKKYNDLYKTNFRRYQIDKIRCTAYETTHCLSLIWPVLDGIVDIEKDDFTTYGTSDHNVKRLINLLIVNTTTFEHQDLYDLLYQISKVPIRLFHWEIEALKALMFVLDHRKEHTFTSVKYGLHLLFEKWLLSFDNHTDLAEKAQIIRPPCLFPEKMKGSTIGHYPKSTRKPNTFTKKKCHSRKPYDSPENDCEP